MEDLSTAEPLHTARPVSRRAFLQHALALTGGLTLGGSLLAACGSPAAAPTTAPSKPAETKPAETAKPQAAPAQPAAAATQQPVAAKPIVFVEGTDVTVFDPTLVTDTPTWSVLALLYDSLVTWDK